MGDGTHWVEVAQAVKRMTAAPYSGGVAVGSPLEPSSELDWDVPCVPSKIVCVGRNYAAHAKELGNDVPEEPLLFLKPPSSLMRSAGDVLLPPVSRRVDFEGEIGLVIGSVVDSQSTDERIREAIFGVTCCNDVTARDLQKADRTFTRGKGFDTFAPCGPWIETEIDVDGLRIETRVNGVVRQSGAVHEMVFSPIELIRYIAGIMTLYPGDLIMTGTPEGVGPLNEGDVVVIAIPGIMELTHGVAVRKGSEN